MIAAAHAASDGNPDVYDYIVKHPDVHWRDGDDGKNSFSGAWDGLKSTGGVTAGTLVKLARDAGMPRKNNLMQQAMALFARGATLKSKKITDLTQNALAAGIPLPDINRVLQEAFAKARTELDGAYFEISAATLEEIFEVLKLELRQNLRHGDRREYRGGRRHSGKQRQIA